MVLIVGGAYQGKRAFAESLGYAPEKIIGPVEEQVLSMLRAGLDPEKEIPQMADQWSDCCVLLTDICCGVVPVDAEARAWREAVGRVGAFLGNRARKVVRVFCGIGTVIKDA